MIEVFRAFESVGIFFQNVRDDCVERRHRPRNRQRRADGTEFEFVYGKRKRRRAVAVGRIFRDGRQNVGTDFYLLFRFRAVRRSVFNRFQYGFELVADEYRHDCRRRFVRSEPVIVSRARNRNAQQILIVVDGADHRGEKKQKARVFPRRIAGLQKTFARIGFDRPVVVLAAAVDAGKRLFMQQAHKPVTARNLFHDLHRQLILIGRQIRRRKNRRHFVLGGSRFVVFRLCKDAELPQLFVQVFHIFTNARRDRGKILVVHLLTLCGLCTEKRPPRHLEISALFIEFFIDQKIFLFGADAGNHVFDVFFAEKTKHTKGLFAERFDGTKERRFFVEGFSRVRTERRRNAQRMIFYERVRRRIPHRVPARFKSGAASARRKRRRIAFAFDKLFAAELHNDAAVFVGSDKTFVLFRRNAGKRLKPMRVVRRAFRNSPLLHRVRHLIRNFKFERRAVVERFFERFKCVFRQKLLHHPLIKNHASEQFLHIRHTVLRRLSRTLKIKKRCKPLLHKSVYIACSFHIHVIAFVGKKIKRFTGRCRYASVIKTLRRSVSSIKEIFFDCIFIGHIPVFNFINNRFCIPFQLDRLYRICVFIDFYNVGRFSF